MRKTKRILIGALMVLMIVFTAACSNVEEIVPKKALTFGDITDENLPAVCDVLNEAGLKNVDTFETWVKKYNSVADQIKGKTGYADADSAMTVMLLADDDIEFKTVSDEYNGSKLFFDLSVIQNSKAYNILGGKVDGFCTMFGEMPISIKGFKRTFPENLRRYGIVFAGQNYQIVNVVVRTDDKENGVIAHSGLLIDSAGLSGVDSSYIFLEKTAYTEPFRLTEINSDSDLMALLAESPDLQGVKKPARVYKNEQFIGDL